VLCQALRDLSSKVNRGSPNTDIDERATRISTARAYEAIRDSSRSSSSLLVVKIQSFLSASKIYKYLNTHCLTSIQRKPPIGPVMPPLTGPLDHGKVKGRLSPVFNVNAPPSRVT
jgi:hypothetical protein